MVLVVDVVIVCVVDGVLDVVTVIELVRVTVFVMVVDVPTNTFQLSEKTDVEAAMPPLLRPVQ
jgi:hypothetical protein